MVSCGESYKTCIKTFSMKNTKCFLVLKVKVLASVSTVSQLGFTHLPGF